MSTAGVATKAPAKGRGKKGKVDEDPEPETEVNEEVDVDQGEDGGAQSKRSRRGRKPKAVYNGFDNPDQLQPSDDENVIMKLNVSQQICDETDTIDDDNMSVPDAFNISACCTYPKPLYIGTFESMDMESMVDGLTYPQDNPTPTNDHSNMCLKVVNLLKDFEEKNKNDEWPTNTSIVCYWCCHRFETPPFGIPVKYTGNKFHVFGCFCSLECAAAHNLASKDSIDDMWERYNLINLLARKIKYPQPYVKPAPNKLSLRMFGGFLGIDEFRNYTNTHKLVNINFPPMLSLTQQIEEINESDINSDFKYIPLDTDRVNKYKEKVRLKRTKPLHDFKNTLDHAMNLKFGA